MAAWSLRALRTVVGRSTSAARSTRLLSSPAVALDVKAADDNLTNHTLSNECQVFRLIASEQKHLHSAALTPELSSQLTKLGNFSMVLRKPTLQLAESLRTLASAPAGYERFVLHGPSGCGKSLALLYAVQLCHQLGWIVFRVNRAFAITHQTPNALEQSGRSPDRFDQNAIASGILRDVQHINGQLLSKVPLRGAYKWGKREMVLPADSTLTQLVQLGLHDARYATDVVNVLVRELKGADIPVLFAIDEFNALLEPHGGFRAPKERRPIALNRLGLWRGISEIVSPTFQTKRGAAVLATSTCLDIVGASLNEPTLRIIKTAEGYKPIEFGRFSDAEETAYLGLLRQTGWLGKEVNPAFLQTMRLQANSTPRAIHRMCTAL